MESCNWLSEAAKKGLGGWNRRLPVGVQPYMGDII